MLSDSLAYNICRLPNLLILLRIIIPNLAFFRKICYNKDKYFTIHYTRGIKDMISIVHADVHFDDKRMITALVLKLKSIKNGDNLTGQSMITTISIALSKTTLPTDVANSIKIVQNPKRGEIVDLTISLEEDNHFTLSDYAKFHEYFQQSLDEVKLF